MPYARTNLETQVSLVTGASSGIGEATARRLAQEGCGKLILIARRGDRLDALRAELETEHAVRCLCITIDLANELERVYKLPQELPPDFAEVDILINCAGLALGKEAADQITLTNLTRVLMTNGARALRNGFPGTRRGHSRPRVI
jgi:short-subunit dehydrogenase